MDKVKQISWKNVFIGVLLVLLGFTVGVVGTVAKVNKQLGYNIRVELDLFK